MQISWGARLAERAGAAVALSIIDETVAAGGPTKTLGEVSPESYRTKRIMEKNNSRRLKSQMQMPYIKAKPGHFDNLFYNFKAPGLGLQ